MDAHRTRRTKDQARKAWYAYHRQVRFARWFGFIQTGADWNQNYLRTPTRKQPEPWSDLAITARVSDWNPTELQFQPDAPSVH
jgi:hypothetical protein